MKILGTLLLLLACLSSAAQNNLLLLKIVKKSDLKIEKIKNYYVAIELDADKLPVKGSGSKLVFFSGFTDSQLKSCVNKDTIRLKNLSIDETFEHENTIGLKNEELVKNISNKMQVFSKIRVEQKASYNQKIEIYYTLLDAAYCVGNITQYDKEFIGYNGKILLIKEIYKIEHHRIPKNHTYDIMKEIDFNNTIW